ncbi:MAG: hypothetical protein MJ247_07305 [Alphaproteobacteria bacterium]|nr:hypothetical protein [Alphaproteobacteria bacterium]
MKNKALYLLIFSFFGLISINAYAKKPTLTAEQQKALELQKEYDKAEKELYSGKISAIADLDILCEQDKLRACSLLGFTYTSGKFGITKSEPKGIEYYQKCVEKEKNFFCHNELGKYYYRHGKYDLALPLFKEGAFKSNSESSYWYGLLYLSGLGIRQNNIEAWKWIKRSAHNVKTPFQPAQCLMSRLTYFGIGQRKSLKDTNFWLNKCDNPFIKSLEKIYGEKKDLEAAKASFKENNLNEALYDWDNFIYKGYSKIGNTISRDHWAAFDCFLPKTPQNETIDTYLIKIFHKDYYYYFQSHDGFVKNFGIGDQLLQICNKTFYTTIDDKKIFNKALKEKAFIKVYKYKNACLSSKITEICNLNFEENKPEEPVEIDTKNASTGNSDVKLFRKKAPFENVCIKKYPTDTSASKQIEICERLIKDNNFLCPYVIKDSNNNWICRACPKNAPFVNLSKDTSQGGCFNCPYGEEMAISEEGKSVCASALPPKKKQQNITNKKRRKKAR